MYGDQNRSDTSLDLDRWSDFLLDDYDLYMEKPAEYWTGLMRAFLTGPRCAREICIKYNGKLSFPSRRAKKIKKFEIIQIVLTKNNFRVMVKAIPSQAQK